MKVLRVSTQLHKWIAVVIGVQILFWVVGGFVMSVIPIERVRSEHQIAQPAPIPLALGELLTLEEAARRAGVEPVEAQLKRTPRGPVWVMTPMMGDPLTVSAVTGKALGAMRPDEARAFAGAAYKGEGRPTSATLLAKPPQESGKATPLWRVDFADAEQTTFYLSPETGEVVTRRSGVWRFYDFFWRLHIMDWPKGENFNNPLIILASLVALTVVVTGFILLWIRLARDLAGWRAARAARRG